MSPFLHMPIAWAGLGLVAVPIIIHLIHRRRLRRLDWAAMEFLLQAARRNRRRIRLEQLLLLLVRITLMALIALFLARPLLSEKGFGWLSSTFQSEEKIFLLDDSLSSAYRSGAGRTFDRAIDALTTALNRLADESSRDRVTVLRTSRPEAPLVRASFIDRERAIELEQSLRALAPTSTRMQLDAALEEIADQLASSADEAAQRPRAISIITDVRATDWTGGAGEASESLRVAFERLLEREENPPRFVVLDIGPPDAPNVAVTEVSVEGGRPTVNVPTEIRVEVRNFGSTPVEDVRVQMTFGLVAGDRSEASTALAPPIAAIPPRGAAETRLTSTFRNQGEYWASVQVMAEGDPLPEDNSLALVTDVVRTTEVLLVDGEPSSVPWEAETDLLRTALSPGSDTAWGIEPVVVVEQNLPQHSLERYGAVFLANVYGLPAAFRARLGRYVRGGGTAVIFLGDQVDPAVYARDFGDGAGAPTDEHPARGILPARIGDLVVTDSVAASLVPSLEHEFLRLLPQGIEAFFQDVQFQRYYELEPGDTARVICRFSDARSRPAIVEGPAGSGRVVLVASSADRDWNDWPANPTYPLFLQEMLAAVGRAQGQAPQSLAGTAIEVPIDITRYQKEARYRDPDYPETPERPLIASPADAEPPATEGSPAPAPVTSRETFRLVVEHSERAGLATIGLTTRRGEEEWRAIAIRSDQEESDLRRIDELEIGRLYPDVPLKVVQDSSGFSEAGRGRFEIADLLMGLFVALCLVEGALACRFAHHRRAMRDTPREARRPTVAVVGGGASGRAEDPRS